MHLLLCTTISWKSYYAKFIYTLHPKQFPALDIKITSNNHQAIPKLPNYPGTSNENNMTHNKKLSQTKMGSTIIPWSNYARSILIKNVLINTIFSTVYLKATG